MKVDLELMQGRIAAAVAEEKPASDVADYIADLARQHGISCARTHDDDLADVITRLADDAVLSGSTDDTLVALKRAHVIDANTMVSLLGKYLDEKRHLRSHPRTF